MLLCLSLGSSNVNQDSGISVAQAIVVTIIQQRTYFLITLNIFDIFRKLNYLSIRMFDF